MNDRSILSSFQQLTFLGGFRMKGNFFTFAPKEWLKRNVLNVQNVDKQVTAKTFMVQTF